MRTVRTHMRPHDPIEVEDAEYLDLQRQGLLLPDPTPARTAGPEPAAPAGRKAAKPATKED